MQEPINVGGNLVAEPPTHDVVNGATAGDHQTVAEDQIRERKDRDRAEEQGRKSLRAR